MCCIDLRIEHLFEQLLPFTFPFPSLSEISKCPCPLGPIATQHVHEHQLVRLNTNRGKKKGKGSVYSHPISRNSSAINDNRFKYQFSACIELRGEASARPEVSPRSFDHHPPFGGNLSTASRNAIRGQEGGRSCQPPIYACRFWLRCGRESIGGVERIGFELG